MHVNGSCFGGKNREICMTVRYEILCINKSNRASQHESITHIGVKANGNYRKLTEAEAINGIDAGNWAFYVNKDGKLVDVIIATSLLGNRYLKTIADGVIPNNLLSLPECS